MTTEGGKGNNSDETPYKPNPDWGANEREGMERNAKQDELARKDQEFRKTPEGKKVLEKRMADQEVYNKQEEARVQKETREMGAKVKAAHEARLKELGQIAEKKAEVEEVYDLAGFEDDGKFKESEKLKNPEK